MKWPWSKPAPVVRELPRAGRRYIRRLQGRITELEREIEILKAQREAQWQRAENNENMLAAAIARPIEVRLEGSTQPHPQWETFAAMMENEKEGPDPEAVEAMEKVAKKANEIWGDELTMEELAERGTKLCDPL